MKFAPLMLLSGLLIAGCSSQQGTEFSSVPGPSGGLAALNSPAPTPAPKPAPAAKPAQPTVAATSQHQPQASQTASTSSKPVAQPKPAAQPIVTQDMSVSAKVASYNVVGKFVVLNFPVGRMGRVDQTMSLYRNGIKVGEVKITGPERDNNIVADLVSGETRVGDEARDR